MRISKVLMISMAPVFVGLLGLTAQADERYTLNYNDQEFRGTATIQLKQALQRSYPDLSLQGANLIGITVTAKSRQGDGEIAFINGSSVIDTARVNGRQADYDRLNQNTFESIEIRGLSRSVETSNWQLRLTGNIKVRSIAVTIEESTYSDVPRFRNFSFLSVGTERADKIFGDSDSFNVRNRIADVILLRTRTGKIDIDRVTVTYVNGRKINVPKLAINMRAGQQAIAYLPLQGRIERVTVRARSRNLFGARATYEVSLGQRRFQLPRSELE